MTDMGTSEGVLGSKRVRYGRNRTIWGKENGFEGDTRRNLGFKGGIMISKRLVDTDGDA